MDRSNIIGPGSGHTMHCLLCGYSGNSYYHQCTGGHCHICGKAHSKRLCPHCGLIVCKDHIIHNPLLSQDECIKCDAENRQEKFLQPEKVEECDCYQCKNERDRFKKMEEARKKMKIYPFPNSNTFMIKKEKD